MQMGYPILGISTLWITQIRAIHFRFTRFESLGPSDATCRYRSGSALVQVMVRCLRHQIQCWILINEVWWHSHEKNFTASTRIAIRLDVFKNYLFKTFTTSQRGQWVKIKRFTAYPINGFLVHCFVVFILFPISPCTSQWRHNRRDDASNHLCLDCLLNRLFRQNVKA